MLSSGNGRHRRPRQAPAAMVTVAATGAGLALPLLGAGVAHAADASTWDKVAVCETGGLWSANTNNGFYGGLAITQETWDEYGGGAYAKRPDLASRSQQITVAEKILADLGPDAWPGCETDTGLLDDTAPPVVDPGSTATPTPDPTAPADPAPTDPAPATGTPGTPTTDPTTPPATKHTGPGKPTAPPAAGGTRGTTPGTPGAGTPSGPTTDPLTPGGTDTGTGAPSAPPLPGGPTTGTSAVPGAPDSSTPAAGGRHAKPYSPTDEELAAADQATRTQVYSVTEKDDSGNSASTADAANKGGESGASAPDDYTVGDGDSLSGIASVHHVDGGWQRLFDANHQVIGDDPNLIKPGQIINLG